MDTSYRLPPGDTVDLSQWRTLPEIDLRKKQGRRLLAEMQPRLNELQELLYANGKHALLIVLQGMDTSGKDGVIKHVIRAFNPQGCHITSFKQPTRKELSHDFLWRVHQATPAHGMVGIFNRSHYEDVLIVRVEELFPPGVWQTRFAAINAFEKLLSDSGTIIVKFHLHISHDEQRKRIEKRLSNPKSHWKFRPDDLDARAKWDEYVVAYEDALSRCNTPYAPWYIIPADKKWYRNLVISRVLVEKLEALEMEWPALNEAWQHFTVD